MKEVATIAAAIGRRWITVVICVILGALLAGGYAYARPDRFDSTATLTVSTAVSAESASDTYQAVMAANQRVRTYAEMVGQSDILLKAAKASHGAFTVDEARRAVSATSREDTSLIEISATDMYPERAADMARLTAQQLIDLVAKVETPPGESTPAVYLSMVGSPTASDASVGAPVWLLIAIGVVLGSIIGVLLALLREITDRTIRNRESAADASGLGVLGEIVDTRDERRNAEPLRHLRTNLSFIDVDKPVRTLLYTSSLPNEGKSYLALGTARVLAEAGNKVVLVDADLRAGQANGSFGRPSSIGLTTVLAGEIEYEDAVLSYSENIDLLPSGSAPPNPSELLGSQAMARTIAKLKTIYDYVIVDSPPVLPVTDAIVVAPLVDAVAVVARAGMVRTDQLSSAMKLLRQTGGRLAGVVINGLKPRAQNSYGAYGTYGAYTSSTRGMLTTGKATANDSSLKPEAAAETTPDSTNKEGKEG